MTFGKCISIVAARLHGERLQLYILVVLAAAFVATSGCSPPGIKVTRYQSLRFYGSGMCNAASISNGSWPDGLIIKLSDGTQLTHDEVTASPVSNKLGAPIETFDDSLAGKIEKFKVKECNVKFHNGTFQSLDAYAGTALVNSKSGKSLTLPATETEIRIVFGKPTEVTSLSRRAP